MESQATTEGPRGTSRAARARCIAAAVLCLLGCLEVGLRATGHRPRLAAVPDEHYGWVLLPNQRTVQDGREVSTNALGFYGEDVPSAADAREGTLVAVLGSSFSVGPGVAMSEGWPAVLESQLGASRPRPVEVANFAVSGYGTQQMRRVYDAYVAPLEPEVLVVEINSGAPVPSFLPADPKSRLNRWLARSAVYDAWAKYVTRDRGARMGPAGSGPEIAKQRRLRELYEDPLGERQRGRWASVESDLEHMVLVQRRHGGKVVVLAAPMLDHWLESPPIRPAEIVAGFDAMGREGAPLMVDVFEDWSPAIQRWLASCERMGFTREGVRVAMRTGAFEELWSANAPPYLVTDPLHWSTEGHRRVANAIVQAMGPSAD